MASKEADPIFPPVLHSSERYLSWAGIEEVRASCLGMVLLDIEALAPAGESFFTPREATRAAGMGPRRLRNFAAARAALKILARRLGLAEESRPDRAVETLGPDDVKPCLGESGLYCSAAHSERYVAAVAHRHRLGVDIEMLSDKAWRTRRLFLKPVEQDLICLSPLGPARAATRLWTIKEAAVKALDLQLFAAFREAEVVNLGEKESVVRRGDKIFRVRHAEGNGHVISLMTADAL